MTSPDDSARRQRRGPQPLPARLARRLHALPLATATGALSLGSAGAAIVYVDFGDQVFRDTVPNDGASQSYPIDFAGDSDPEFSLRVRVDNTVGNRAAVTGPAGGILGVIGSTAGAYFYPARLTAGSVGPSALFLTLSQSQPGSLAFANGYPNSRWADNAPDNTGWLGIRFDLSGADHYGWVRLTVGPQLAASPRSVTLHEIAWESEAGKFITLGAVPEPGGLGLLALGSVGLSLLRRRARQGPNEQE